MKEGYKKCPYCREEIRQEAIKCRYCREFLDKNENINSKDYGLDPRKNAKISEYFGAIPFCPHCNNRLNDWTSKCPYCDKSINLEKYYPVEDAYSFCYKYNKKAKSMEPFVYCSTCHYLGYAKDKSHWRFRDGGWGWIELALGKIKLEYIQGFICPNCQSDELLINTLEQIKIEINS